MKGQSDDIHHLTISELVRENQTPSGNCLYTDDCLVELRNRYLPLIKSTVAGYFVSGAEYEDWVQDATEELIKVISRFDASRGASFGAFYKRCIKNRFNDQVRRENAKKRIPNQYLTSYSANQNYYDDVLRDAKATQADRSFEVNETLTKLMLRCSRFEKIVLSNVAKYRSPEFIAKNQGCSVAKVKNALARCRRKYQKMLNNRSN